jgi:hypothetical protein
MTFNPDSLCPKCGHLSKPNETHVCNPARAVAVPEPAIDGHTVVCQAVALMTQGESVKAHDLLREWLVAWTGEAK